MGRKRAMGAAGGGGALNPSREGWRCGGGGECHRAEGNDARVLPFAVGVVGDEHVVAVVGAEGRVFAEIFGEAGLRGTGEGDCVENSPFGTNYSDHMFV